MATDLQPGYVYLGQKGAIKVSRRKLNRLSKKYGLPSPGMAQISKGEANRILNVQQRDPGDGMVGFGLFQFTPNAWGKGTAAMKKWESLGGAEGIVNDIDKQFKMARFLYKSAGNSFKPWYGTRYLTDRTGEGTLGPVKHGMNVAPPTMETGQAEAPVGKGNKLFGSYEQTKTDISNLLTDSILERKSGMSLFDDVSERLQSGAYDTTTRTDLRSSAPPSMTGGVGDERRAARESAGMKPGNFTVREGANRSGVPLNEDVTRFLGKLAGRYGEFEVGTGSNHSKMTVSGNVSDHWDGHGADIPATGKQLELLLRKALIQAGMPRKQAIKSAKQGGLFNLTKNGKRYQIIGRTTEGGNHWDHLHVGIR